MKCPNCGNEIQDGHLICETCGYEIRMVPDYEPGSDEQIDKTVIEDGKAAEEKEDEGDAAAEKQEPQTGISLRALKNHALGVAVVACITLIMVAGVLFIILRTAGLDYQLEKIKNKAAGGKYEEAISSLENQYVHHPEESRILFLEAEYYILLGKRDMAEDTYFRMLNNSLYTDDDRLSVYDRLIALYVEAQDYESIAALLGECPYAEIVTAYQNYLAMPPSFSLEEGTYTDVIRLKLSANTSGTIYYTMDGSVPNETSSVYSGTIVLETGSYSISAIFVNQYGLVSDPVTKNYDILVDAPPEPEVNLDTGSYTSPELITVTVPEGTRVYYTTDKSVPTIDSVPYTGPIPVPLNTSNFNFAAINEQGLSSETVVRSYYLSFPGGLSSSQAVDTLKRRMVERGLLNDMSGTSDRAPGIYTYAATSAVYIEGQGSYYIIREFYDDIAGSVTTSDTTYIVEIYQGSTGILGGDAAGGFLALAF